MHLLFVCAQNIIVDVEIFVFNCGAAAARRWENEKCFEFWQLGKDLAQNANFHSISALCCAYNFVQHCALLLLFLPPSIFFLHCHSRLLCTKFNQATIAECFRIFKLICFRMQRVGRNASNA